MRVLYVNHTGRVSGGEHSLLTLLASLPAGVEPAVACPDGELAGRLEALGVPRLPLSEVDGGLRLHPVHTPRALLEMVRASAEVRAAAAAHRPDLVHANSIRSGLLVALSGVRPAIAHVRDCLPEGAASSLSLRTIARLDGLIANSEHTRASLGAQGRSARVVHNSVDLGRFAGADHGREAMRARLGLPARAPVLAVVAQITPWKGQDVAIAALAALRREHPDATLLLIGAVKFDAAATRFDNRAYLARLERQAAPLGEGAVRFLGERDDVPDLLAAVDLLLVPSWEEPFGRSVVEAMAAGVPVLATDVGGPAEILRPARAGILLPPRDPAPWAASAARLLADPAAREAMGRRGREDAGRRFGVERHAAAIAALYAEVTGGLAAAAA